MIDPLDAYRRTLTASDETVTAWWYLGTTSFTTDGHPEIIINHVETVMLYRAEAICSDAFRVPWWEIGLFRDAATGEIVDDWVNPLTGARMAAARTFEEGPSGYTVQRDPAGGIVLTDAVQALAKVESASIDVLAVNGRIRITQVERKTRSFPGRDGIPDLDAGQSSRSHTILQWFADEADLATAAPSVPATGLYSLRIAAPPWLGMEGRSGTFAVKGLMRKAPLDMPLNPRGWRDLKRLFPHYFEGDTILPRWG